MAQKQAHTSSLLCFRSSVFLVRVVRQMISAMVVLQAITILVLWLVAVLRRRRMPVRGFPRLDLDEVCVGENTLRLYGYGRDLYDAMIEAIDNAKESIYLETFIWKDDAVGWEFKTHLAQKAMEGVAVYVIFDGFGNLVVPPAFKVFPPEIHVLEYQPFHHFWHLLDPRRYSLDHRKLLVIDGSIGFIGGFNIGSLYATQWRDTHLRIFGPATADLAYSFIEFWNRSNPRRTIQQHYPRRFDPLITLHENDALRLTFPIRDMYIAAIDQAEHWILLSNAYFVPDRFLLEALEQAAMRGVDVRILVPWLSNHIVVDWLTRGYFTRCLRAGMRIFAYSHTMLHAKTCSIDGQWSTVGTANLDRLSSIGNYEVNIEIYSPELAQQMQALFECDSAGVFELTLEDWIKRPWYSKLSEVILSPLRFFL